MEFRDEAKLHDVTVAQNQVDLLQMLQTVGAGAGKVMLILESMRFRKDTQIRVMYTLYYVILYYIISYYIISYYTILYYIILYYIILSYIILYYILLYYIILYYIVL